ncbi:hypothetical protein [Flagellimonas lutaonensis]|nr:hypothetical protein [Allomuricauda lutaonensis]
MAKIRDLKSNEAKQLIVRNLNRILDFCILDIDIERGTLYFIYATPLTLEKAKRELRCIGHPMDYCILQKSISKKHDESSLKA